MRTLLTLALSLTLVLPWIGSPVWAQDAPAADQDAPAAPAPEAAEPVEAAPAEGATAQPEVAAAEPQVVMVRVVKVEGDVEVQLPGQDWATAEKDMELPEGTRIFTGLDATLMLSLGGIGIVRVLAFSEIEVSQFLLSENNVISDLDLRTGEVQVSVDKGDYQASLQVRTPNATASVRGTVFVLGSSGGFGATCRGREGSVAFRPRSGGRTEFVGAGDSSRKQPGQSGVQRTTEARKEASTTNVTPQGATRSERRAATRIAAATSGILASDTTQQQGNPAFQRIINRDQRANDASREERRDIRSRDVVPPVATQ